MQDQHSFDNYFGTRPGVDGIPHGVCMPVHARSARPCVAPTPIDAANYAWEREDQSHTRKQKKSLASKFHVNTVFLQRDLPQTKSALAQRLEISQNVVHGFLGVLP